MKRWLVWFAIGMIAFLGGGVLGAIDNPLAYVFVIVLLAWIPITLLAVPVCVIIWLSRRKGGTGQTH